MDPRRILIIAGACVGLGALAYGLSGVFATSRVVSKNVEAHGGAEAIEAVQTLRITGQMDLGHDLTVPYVMEQKRPNKLCLEYPFDGEQVVQCTNGTSGYKIEPFRDDSPGPVPLTDDELRQVVDASVPMGILVDRWSRGIDLTTPERVTDGDRVADVVEVEMPSGATRTVYLDPVTGLEYKMESTQQVAGREIEVTTTFHEWQKTGGVSFARRQVTTRERDDESYELTIDNVQINPPLSDDRFEMPATTARNP